MMFLFPKQTGNSTLFLPLSLLFLDITEEPEDLVFCSSCFDYFMKAPVQITRETLEKPHYLTMK